MASIGFFVQFASGVLGSVFLATVVQDTPAPAAPSQESAPAAIEQAGRVPMEWDRTALVSLEVADLKASLAWYEGVLGCERVLVLEEMGWAEVRTPVAGLVIGLGLPEPGKARQTNGPSRLVLGVKDIEAARRWLLEQKVSVDDIQVIPEMVKLVTFRDPDGNGLMFSQTLAAAGR